MTSVYLGKICVRFLELPFLKRNENTVFLSKGTLMQNVPVYLCSYKNNNLKTSQS